MCSSYHRDILWYIYVYIYIHMYDIARETSSLQIIMSQSTPTPGHQGTSGRVPWIDIRCPFGTWQCRENHGEKSQNPMVVKCLEPHVMFPTKTAPFLMFCDLSRYHVLWQTQSDSVALNLFEYHLRNQRPPIGNQTALQDPRHFAMQGAAPLHGWSCGRTIVKTCMEWAMIIQLPNV